MKEPPDEELPDKGETEGVVLAEATGLDVAGAEALEPETDAGAPESAATVGWLADELDPAAGGEVEFGADDGEASTEKTKPVVDAPPALSGRSDDV